MLGVAIISNIKVAIAAMAVQVGGSDASAVKIIWNQHTH
jgi:hypothetical protein